jgi:signal transduction histidine kinase
MGHGEAASSRSAQQEPPPIESRRLADPGDALRTPLHSIRSAADVILAGDAGAASADVLALVAAIAEAVDLLERQVERRFARPVAGVSRRDSARHPARSA